MSNTKLDSITPTNDGAICGGVVNETYYYQETAKDVWALAMASVLPDEHFKEYQKLKEAGKHDEATKLFNKYGWSAL